MREIKFRAWDGEKMGWVPIKAVQVGDYLEMEGTTLTLMQYTGLKDKNGKEIYEGDIIARLTKSHGFAEHHQKFEVVRWVKRTGYEPFQSLKPSNISTDLKVHAVTVMGNIFENPELLKD